MVEFTMPSLGADMDEGRLLEWLVKPGDAVHKGDVVAVVDTSKAAVEVETFRDGTVEALLVEPGTMVPVGTPLARITTPPTVAPTVPASAAPTAAHTTPRAAIPSPSAPEPRIRRLARDLEVDLATVHGTGSGGRITRQDVVHAADGTAQRPPAVERVDARVATPAPSPPQRSQVTPYARRLAAELGVDLSDVPLPETGVVRAADIRAAAAAAPPEPESTPATAAQVASWSGDRKERMRATIAAVMSRSKREIPHYYLSSTVDLGAALDWMGRRNLELPVSERLVPAALMLKATALAAVEVPELNGFWTDGRFQPGAGVHLGVAVALRGGGLVAPAIHHAADRSLTEMMAAMRDVVVRARSGRLRDAELRDPTLTVTNLGEQGVESVLGVIYPPQVALVGFGRVMERPWSVDGLLGVRPLTVLTLAADHRATDGFTGSRLLAAIDRHLQRPEKL
ncbi:dihydrolipoamide acetyltransferase family protein [Nocardioides sp. AN3]